MVLGIVTHLPIKIICLVTSICCTLGLMDSHMWLKKCSIKVNKSWIWPWISEASVIRHPSFLCRMALAVKRFIIARLFDISLWPRLMLFAILVVCRNDGCLTQLLQHTECIPFHYPLPIHPYPHMINLTNILCCLCCP